VSASATEFYYVDQANQRQGPVSEDNVFQLVSESVIVGESLLWTAGMTDWRRADSFDRFATLFERTVVMPPSPAGPSRPATPQPAEAPASAFVSAPTAAPTFSRPAPARAASSGPASAPSGALVASLPVWGLFGYALLTLLGSIVVVPSPWTSTMLYRFVFDHVALPNGTRFRFTGQPADIWPVFVGISLTFWLRQVPYGGLPAALISWVLGVLVLRWLCQKLETEHGPLNLSFQGEILPYIGWNVLLIVSCITIVGWAWVMQYMLRWICQNVRGACGFEFHGTGLEILWRTLVTVFGSIFLIPIPWLLQWYMNWIISRIHVVPAPA
jgi:GYF domain 2